jgi:4-aminobutyrate aminotransferase-like enzyme
MIVPPPDYFREVKRVLDKYQMLFIADEVQSGNGRTGKLWGIEHYGVAPDVMTTSKAIANGLPLGVTMINEVVDSGLKPGEHYSTLGGNALSCAAAMVVLDELTTGLIDTAKENGEYFKKRLFELMDRHELVGDVRGEGFFLGMELVKDRKTKEPAKEVAAKLLQETFKRKMLIGLGGLDGNVVRIEPPLVLTREHIDESIDVFDEALRACRS